MIILSDGDTTACNSQAYSAYGGNNSCSNGSQIVAVNCPSVSGTGTCGSTSESINGSATTIGCPPGGCTGKPLNGTGTSTSNSTAITWPHIHLRWASAGRQCRRRSRNSRWNHRLHNRYGFGDFRTVPDGPTRHGHVRLDERRGSISVRDFLSGQPCNAIAAMASTENTFYSDDTGGCAALVNTSAQFETISGIFQAIANSLTNARLIPAGAF